MPRVTFIAVVLCFSTITSRADEAQPADVEFHTAAISFPCRDKTPKEFADANPDRKIIEATIRISATFNMVDGDVDRIEYKLKMPTSFEITDYLPKTVIGSEIAGPIGVGRQEGSKSLTVVSMDAGAKAEFRMPQGADIGGTASVGKKEENAKEIGSSVQMNYLPPKQLITAASTQDAGQTLHFKLKQFNQITLEGDKTFAFLAAVPKEWKDDCFTLECAAFFKGVRASAFRKTLKIGLYSIGDLTAKKRVETLSKNYEPIVVQQPKNKVVTMNGRYRFVMTAGNLGKQGIDAIYKPDGTWEGWLRNIEGTTWKEFGASQVRGTWAIASGKLTLIHTESAVFGITPWFKDGKTQVDAEPIVSCDNSGVITLKSGGIFEPVR